jgi:hypothetical protein
MVEHTPSCVLWEDAGCLSCCQLSLLLPPRLVNTSFYSGKPSEVSMKRDAEDVALILLRSHCLLYVSGAQGKFNLEKGKLSTLALYHLKQP